RPRGRADPLPEPQDDPAGEPDQEEELGSREVLVLARVALCAAFAAATGPAATGPAATGPAAAGTSPAAPPPGDPLAGALAAALPTGASTDVVLIDHPSAPRAPRVHAATPVGAPPAAVKAVLLDTAHYRAIIPGLVKVETAPAA